MPTKPEKTIRHVNALCTFSLSKFKELLLWDTYYNALPHPKVKQCVLHDDPNTHKEIIQKLKKNNLNIIEYHIALKDYKNYITKAEYNHFSNYLIGGGAKCLIEKTLEHYLAAKFLELNPNDIYIDIGSADSPTPEIYHKLYGCKVFRQDIMFPQGIHKNIIGGDACNLPIPDGFATKLGLHCSFEHFEQNSDKDFLKEAARILRKKGKLCIIPLYLFKHYAIQTNPAYMPKKGIPFEKNAILHCVKNWSCRHNRFYDVPQFMRLIKHSLTDFDLKIYVIKNSKQVSKDCYVKFAALFEKK